MKNNVLKQIVDQTRGSQRRQFMVTAKYKLNTMKISISLNGYGKRNVCPFSFQPREAFPRGK